MAQPTLQHSDALTREALRLLLQAPLEPDLEVAELPVRIAADKATAAARGLTLRWDGGEIDLVFRIAEGNTIRRGTEEDTGHGLGIGVHVGTSRGHVLWKHFEWDVRDALREGKRAVPLIARNSFYQRTGNNESRNSVHGEQARRFAAASGLPDAADVTCGTYDLRTRMWSPDAQTVLRTFLVIAVIKAHFFREGLEHFRGHPLLDVELGALSSTPADASSETDEETPASPPPPPSPPPPTFTRLALHPADIAARLPGFIAPPGVLERCCAALNSGKHVLLLGPPGTGKSTLAQALASQACVDGACGGEPLLATASADWSTYDTIGGWSQRADGRLVFREGVFTRALRERRWIVLDEVNRADIDKCFGELFTVLSGGDVTTAYTRLEGEREVPIEIGASVEPYRFGSHIRLIATMNVRDKASLFRLSYAFMRRFAAIHVPALDDAGLLRLAKADGEARELHEAVWTLAARALTREHGFGAVVDLGPALLRDVLAYAAARLGAVSKSETVLAMMIPGVTTITVDHAVAEAIELLVFPQLEGAEDGHALEADARVDNLFTEPDVRRGLHEALRSYFPTLQRRRS